MKKHLKGQFYLAFLTLAVPVFLLMMVVVVDFGNYLTMRSMVRSLADSSALAAAGAVDMGGKDGSSGGTEKGSNYTLNARWAKARAEEVFRETINGNQPKYVSAGRTDFTLSISVSGKRATATVTGTYRRYGQISLVPIRSRPQQLRQLKQQRGLAGRFRNNQNRFQISADTVFSNQ